MIAELLLDWYDENARDLPWRALPGQPRKQAYHVWLSEIMLQQTTVATVGPYYRAFLKKWPTVNDLAAADLDDVLHMWQGLGYYARARNLHKCALTVAWDHAGIFPDTEADLLKLPGVGPYTAAAIAAIAFNKPASPVDGNIERVIARLQAIETELPAAKKEIAPAAATLVPQNRPGDYVQGMMDLGATICLPKNPSCLICPLQSNCLAFEKGIAAELPRRGKKKAKPNRYAWMFFVSDAEQRMLLKRRAEQGLLGGMMEFPSTPWREEQDWDFEEALSHAPMSADWQPLPGAVKHTFTHFHLHVRVCVAELSTTKDKAPEDETWCPPAAFNSLALPTLMKKAARHRLQSP